MHAMRVPLPGMHAVLSPVQAPLPGGEAALIGLAALAVVMLPFLWPLVEHFSAMAHEGAHAITATAVGFTVDHVELDIESRGATEYVDAPDTGPRRTLTRFVGYLGPSAFGLCAAKMIETGHVAAVLWVAVLLLVLLLFVIRGSFARYSVPGAIAVLALVMHYTRAGLEEAIVYGMTWLLLLSGVRVAAAHGVTASDAGHLTRTTHIPRPIWALLWLAGTVLAVVIGGKWLVLRTG
jgi:hypothetical protein